MGHLVTSGEEDLTMGGEEDLTLETIKKTKTLTKDHIPTETATNIDGLEDLSPVHASMETEVHTMREEVKIKVEPEETAGETNQGIPEDHQV